MRNWDRYKTKQVTIEKAKYNPLVIQLTQQHYNALYKKLVRSQQDEDTFNDTFLKLTQCYQPSEDFVQQFTYQFNLLKGSYYRYDKQANWLITFTDNLPERPELEPEQVKKIQPKNLLKAILDYAITQKIQTA